MERKNRVAGVYTITCTANGRKYVGSSTNCRSRWSTHKTWLRHGRHYIGDLQADWNEYGRSAFEFRIVGESRDRAMRMAMEQAALDKAWDAGLAYNLSRSAEAAKGFKRSPEYRQAIREGAQERWANTVITPEFRERMAEMGRMGKGRPKSVEHRAKIAAAQRRTWAVLDPEEVRRRTAAAGRGNLGKPKSAEHRRNMAIGRKNNKLTEDQVRMIKRRIATGEHMTAIAADYPVSFSMISNIKRGRSWKHVAA